MEQQDKTKLRLSVSTMINASGFSVFLFFFQIGLEICSKKLFTRVIGLVSYFSLYAYELVDKRQIEVVYIITKKM